jgi:HD-GYP domain-containing protein (c-di-GMP phosphodiesterase class II)
MEAGDWIGGLPPDAPRLLFGGRPEDDEHGREVARVAVAVAKGLGLPALTRSRLALAGRLHDIGKLEWPAALREKRESLSPDDWAQIRLHPVVGAQTCARLGLPAIAPWVRSHHERPDGLGYPDRLRGDEIPVEARVLAVADAFDAMTSDRPYRPAMSVDQAYDELEANAGSQFDPTVVRTLLSLSRRIDLADREDRIAVRVGGA